MLTDSASLPEITARLSGARGTVFALGSGITLLGVLRALSEAGINVWAQPDVSGAVRRSRWFHAAPSVFVGVRPDTLQPLLETLPEGTVLMPCSDFWLRAVAALPADFRIRYPASIAPLEALDLLVDKAGFARELECLRLPHPETHLLLSTAVLSTIPDSSLKNFFLKPVHSQQFFAHFGVKAFRIETQRDASDKLASCAAAGLQMLLQEYIPGPASNHYFIDGFVDRTGVVRALFCRRRLRMNPPDFGNSTSMVSVPVADTGDSEATLRALFAAIHYRGIFSAEFKRDERDHRFKLVEVNARPWWYVEFAARCGVNVCELAVRDALGEPVPTIADYAIGRRCVFPYYDLGAVRRELSTGRIGLVEWAHSWLGAYQPVFRWSDPLPAAGEIPTLLGRRLARMTTRVRS